VSHLCREARRAVRCCLNKGIATGQSNEGLFMNPQTQAILDAALALPEAERALLAERLLESVSPEADELTDDEFFAELERRRMEVEQGLVKPIPWSEVRLEE
jgi:putative addiction module component (TIGR02574 family)